MKAPHSTAARDLAIGKNYKRKLSRLLLEVHWY